MKYNCIIYIIIIIFFLWIIKELLLSFYCKIRKTKSIKTKNNENIACIVKRNSFRTSISCFFQGYLRLQLKFLSNFPSHVVRSFFLKNVFHMTIGKHVTIYSGFEIRDPWNITIGNGSIIGDNSILDGRNGIYIGNNVNFSTGVWIWTEQHDLNDSYFNCNNKGGEVKIQDRVWIGSRVIVLPKTTIDEGAVIAAGAVVTNNCEKFGVYMGVPATLKKFRNNNLKYEFDGSHYWFL